MFSQKWRTMTDHERWASVSRHVDVMLKDRGHDLSKTQRLWGLMEATKTTPPYGQVTSFTTAVGRHTHKRSGYLVHAKARGNSGEIPDLTVFVPFKLRVRAPASFGGKPVLHANTMYGKEIAQTVAARLKEEFKLRQAPAIKVWFRK